MRLCIECGERETRQGYRRCRRCRNADYEPCACGARKTRGAGCCRSCFTYGRGPSSPGWRGGRNATSDGYIRVWSPDHPRAASGRRSHVLEHILVMESTLGRYLFPDETVHHKNGQRNDNRPENLELWSKAHPPGQRVEDKVAWMREFIARYEGVSV